MKKLITHSKHLIKLCSSLIASNLGPHRRPTGSPRLWVLMYHRIIPVTDPRFAPEEPGMLVTPDSFRQHLRILKKRFELLPLSEWVERRNSGKSLPLHACTVTFDDGWLDNYQYALPILQQENVPATIFAVAQMIGTQREFWPNRLSRILSAGSATDDLPWLKNFSGEPTEPLSRDKIAAVISECKRLSDDELNTRLDEAEAQLGIAKPNDAALMNWDQLRATQASGLVEIGSHTCNHRRLICGLDSALVAHEVIESKAILQAQLEKPISLFCYPNGDVSLEALRLVHDHYAGAVTTRRGINTNTTRPHELLRIGVHEDIADTATRFEARLSGWI